MRILACAILTLSLLLQDAPVEMRVVTTDGSTLNGKGTLTPLKLKTEYGEATLEPGKIKTINVSGATIIVETWDKNTISGEGKLDAVVIETSLGKMTVKPEKIMRIEVTKAPAGAQPPPNTSNPQPPTTADPRIPAGPKVPNADLGADRVLYQTPVLTSDEKYVAIADRRNGELLLISTEDLGVSIVKVEAYPQAILERDGKLFVANRDSSSISIVDPAQKKVTGRIQLTVKPTSITGPAAQPLLYVGSEKEGIAIVDYRTGKEMGAIVVAASNSKPRSSTWVTVTPDNAYLYIQGDLDHSPTCVPELWFLDGNKITYGGFYHHEDHQPLIVSYASNRVYGGRQVYTLDLRDQPIKLGCGRVSPHPKAPVLFGVPGIRQGMVQGFDEETAAPFMRVVTGEAVHSLVAGMRDVFCFSATRVMKVPAASLAPADALEKSRRVRLALDPAKPPSKDAIAKAESLGSEAGSLLRGGNAAGARAKYEDSVKADALGPGHVGIGASLLAAGKHQDCIDYMREVRAFPYRKRDTAVEAFRVLAQAYAHFDERRDEATTTVENGIILAPKDARILEAGGQIQRRYKNLPRAYVLFARAIEADGRAKKEFGEVESEMRKAATPCPNCEGKGKFERVVQEEGKPNKKITVKCDACDGCGKAWRKPCLACCGIGRVQYGDACEKCWGAGAVLAPGK